jgi:hypothetical protein
VGLPLGLAFADRGLNVVFYDVAGCDHFIAGAAMIGGISYFHA